MVMSAVYYYVDLYGDLDVIKQSNHCEKNAILEAIESGGPLTGINLTVGLNWGST